MDFDLRVFDKFTVIDFPEGEMNFTVAKSVKERIKELIKLGHKYLIFNLSKVEYIDSTALGILISIHKLCLTSNGELRLCCPNSEIEMILYLTGVDKFLNIYFSENEALTLGNLKLVKDQA